jgi:hypothetical protein
MMLALLVAAVAVVPLLQLLLSLRKLQLQNVC